MIRSVMTICLSATFLSSFGCGRQDEARDGAVEPDLASGSGPAIPPDGGGLDWAPALADAADGDAGEGVDGTMATACASPLSGSAAFGSELSGTATFTTMRSSTTPSQTVTLKIQVYFPAGRVAQAHRCFLACQVRWSAICTSSVPRQLLRRIYPPPDWLSVDTRPAESRVTFCPVAMACRRKCRETSPRLERTSATRAPRPCCFVRRGTCQRRPCGPKVRR